MQAPIHAYSASNSTNADSQILVESIESNFSSLVTALKDLDSLRKRAAGKPDSAKLLLAACDSYCVSSKKALRSTIQCVDKMVEEHVSHTNRHYLQPVNWNNNIPVSQTVNAKPPTDSTVNLLAHSRDLVIAQRALCHWKLYCFGEKMKRSADRRHADLLNRLESAQKLAEGVKTEVHMVDKKDAHLRDELVRVRADNAALLEKMGKLDGNIAELQKHLNSSYLEIENLKTSNKRLMAATRSKSPAVSSSTAPDDSERVRQMQNDLRSLNEQLQKSDETTQVLNADLSKLKREHEKALSFRKDQLGSKSAQNLKLKAELEEARAGDSLATREDHKMIIEKNNIIRQLNLSIDEKSAKISDLEKQHIEANELRAHLAERDGLIRRLETEAAEALSTRDQVFNLTSQVSKWKEKLKHADDDIKQLSIDLKHADEELDAATAEKIKLESAISTRDIALDNLKKRVSDLESERERLLADRSGGPSSARSPAVKASKSEVLTLQAKCERFETEIIGIQDELTAVAAERDKAVAEMALLRNEIVNFKTNSEKAEADMRSTVSDLEHSKRTLDKNLKEANADRQNLTQEITDLKLTIISQDERIAAMVDLEKDLAKAHKEIGRLEANLKSRTGDSDRVLTEIRQQLSQAERRCEDLRHEISDLKLDLKTKSEESAFTVESLSNDVSALEKRLNESESKKKSLLDQLAIAKDEIAAHKAKIGSISESAERTRQRLAEDLEAANSDIARLTQIIAEGSAEVSNLRAKVSGLESVKKFLEEQLRESRAHEVTKIAEPKQSILADKLSQSEKFRDDLQQQLLNLQEVSSAEILRLSSLVSEDESQLANLRATITKLERDLETAQRPAPNTIVQESESVTADLERKLRDERDLVHQLTITSNALRVRISELESELQSSSKPHMGSGDHHLVSRVEELEKHSHLKDQQCKALMLEETTLRAQIGELQRDQNHLQTQLDQMKDDLAMADSEVDRLSKLANADPDADRVAQLTAEMKDLEDELNSLDKLLVSKDQREKELLAQINLLDSDLNAAENEIEDLNTRLAESASGGDKGGQLTVKLLQEQLELKTQAETELRERVEEVERAYEDMLKNSSGSEKEIQSLTAQLNEAEAAIMSCEDQLNEADQAVDSLETELRATRAERDSLDTELKEKFAEIAGLTTKLGDAQGPVQMYQNRLAEAEATLASLRAERSAGEAERDTLKANLTHKVSEVHTLGVQIEEATSALQSLQQQLLDKDETLSVLRSDLAALQSEKSNLISSIDKKESESTVLQDQIQRMKSTANATGDALKDALSEKEFEMSELRMDMERLRSELEHTTSVKNQAEEHSTELRKHFDANLLEVATLSAELGNIKSEKDRLASQLESVAGSSDNRIGELTKALSAAENEGSQLRIEISKINSELKDVSATKTALEARSDSFASQEAQWKQSLDHASNELKEIKASLKGRREKLAISKALGYVAVYGSNKDEQVVSLLQDQVKQAEARQVELLEERVRLEAIIAAKDKELNDLRASGQEDLLVSIHKLMDEKSSLTDRLARLESMLDAREQGKVHSLQMVIKDIVSQANPPILLSPLSQHVSVDAGGSVATYVGLNKDSDMSGCLITNAPLPVFDEGLYFEVRVTSASSGNPDGLTVGITTTRPWIGQPIPNTLDDIPQSWAVGYNGQTWNSAKSEWKQIAWNGKDLTVGQRVGVLVAAPPVSQLFVFVDDTLVCRGPARLPSCIDYPYFGIIDLLGNCDCVTLLWGARPPSAAADLVPVDPRRTPTFASRLPMRQGTIDTIRKPILDDSSLSGPESPSPVVSPARKHVLPKLNIKPTAQPAFPVRPPSTDSEEE